MPQYSLIIPVNLKPRPDLFEEKVARICATEFQSDILFIKRSASTTPDIQVVKTRQYWEIKNIQGNGKNTIEDNLKRASKQSDNVIISLMRSKMSTRQATARIQHFLKHKRKNLKKVILITKTGKCIAF